jgi:hypothetical protein
MILLQLTPLGIWLLLALTVVAALILGYLINKNLK